MVEDLEDLFSTPRAADDKSLSTDGVEELFDTETGIPPDEGLTLAEPVSGGEASAPPAVSGAGSIHELLESLAADLKQLAEDIHKLLEP